MALIECKDCGRSVSTEAAACPQCGRASGPSGHPAAVRQSDSAFMLGLKLVAVACFIAFLAMVLGR